MRDLGSPGQRQAGLHHEDRKAQLRTIPVVYLEMIHFVIHPDFSSSASEKIQIMCPAEHWATPSPLLTNAKS